MSKKHNGNWHQKGGDLFDGQSGGGKGSYMAPRCYETHKALKLGDTGLVIYGGSSSTPVVTDADVYVAFDYVNKDQRNRFPWEDQGPVIIDFYIPDQSVAKDVKNFKKLVTYTCEQLKAGKKVHGGCIGGHGRTGTWLAAVVKELLGIEDAITYVRTNYCHKAVESQTQIDFLVKHYGVKPAEPRKLSGMYTGGGVVYPSKGGSGSSVGFWQDDYKGKGGSKGPPTRQYKAIQSNKSLFTPPAKVGA